MIRHYTDLVGVFRIVRVEICIAGGVMIINGCVTAIEGIHVTGITGDFTE